MDTSAKVVPFAGKSGGSSANDKEKKSDLGKTVEGGGGGSGGGGGGGGSGGGPNQQSATAVAAAADNIQTVAASAANREGAEFNSSIVESGKSLIKSISGKSVSSSKMLKTTDSLDCEYMLVLTKMNLGCCVRTSSKIRPRRARWRHLSRRSPGCCYTSWRRICSEKDEARKEGRKEGRWQRLSLVVRATRSLLHASISSFTYILLPGQDAGSGLRLQGRDHRPSKPLPDAPGSSGFLPKTQTLSCRSEREKS